VVVEHAVERGRRQVASVPLDRARTFRFLSVHREVEHLHLHPAMKHGGVRVALDVGEGVVLAVDRHPLPWPDACGHPNDKAEHMDRRRSHHERPMSEGAVQVHGGGQIRQDAATPTIRATSTVLIGSE